MSFYGLVIDKKGQPRRVTVASTISEATQRANELRAELTRRSVHPDVLRFCKAELLQDNYFHCVLEATKSVGQKIRDKAGIEGDGAALAGQAFSIKTPLAPKHSSNRVGAVGAEGLRQYPQGRLRRLSERAGSRPEDQLGGQQDGCDGCANHPLLHPSPAGRGGGGASKYTATRKDMIRANGDYSVLGWIDFSSEHREKVKTVIDLLHVSEVVDELGIGTIRDCFSDTLFPGISTIQTRAKYFLTLPRLLREYQALPPHFRRKHALADWLNDQENQCMKFLHKNHRSDRQTGIIGVEFAEKPGEVQRKPSSVYWNGLRLFGLVKTRLSPAEFLRKFANPDAPLLDLIEGTDDTKGDDRDAIDVTSPLSLAPTKDQGVERTPDLAPEL